MATLTLPEDVLEFMDHAEEALKASDEAVVFSTIKDQELEEALDEQEEARDCAFEAMEEALASAALFLDSIKAHFDL